MALKPRKANNNKCIFRADIRFYFNFLILYFPD
jgi:hypothetical protein